MHKDSTHIDQLLNEIIKNENKLNVTGFPKFHHLTNLDLTEREIKMCKIGKSAQGCYWQLHQM